MKRLVFVSFFIVIILVRFKILYIKQRILLEYPQLPRQVCIVRSFKNNCLGFNYKYGYVLLPRCGETPLYKTFLVSGFGYTSNFWRKLGIELLAKKYIEVDIEKQFSWCKILRFFYIKKLRFYEKVRKLSGGEIASIFVAMLFGADDFLDTNVIETFRKLSLMHVLVISGYNIQLVLQKIDSILKKLLYYSWRLVFLSFLSVFFILVLGLSPPIIRATLSVILANILSLIGIKISFEDKLLIVILFMLLFNPVWLKGLSFQLSVLATVAVYVAGILLKRLNISNVFLENFVTMLCVTLFTGPLLFIKLHTLPTIKGFIANVILLPLIEMVTYVGYTGLPLLLLSEIISSLNFLGVTYLFLTSNSIAILLVLINFLSNLAI